MRRLLPLLLLSGLWILAPGPLLAQNAGLVTDLHIGADPFFAGFSEPLLYFKNAFYFWGSSPVTGTELWKSNGTPSGTRLLKDICQGPCSSWPRRSDAVVLGERFFFTACDEARQCQVWKSDGSAAGTEIVEALGVPDGIFQGGPLGLPSQLTAFDGALYFFTHDPEVGVELWKSDGTAAGTAVFKDLRPGPDASFYGQTLATADRLFLLSGRDVWTSDGTKAGTIQIATLPERKYITLGPKRLGALALLPVMEQVLPTELWRSDGTASGTFKIWEEGGWISEIVVAQDQAFFRDHRDQGIRLWRTDGTTEGTVLLHEGLSSSSEIGTSGKELYFTAGTALWITDGSVLGTREVTRFSFRRPGSFLALGEELLFHVDSEIWRSGGTADSTEFLIDTNRRIRHMIPFGDRLGLSLRGAQDDLELMIVDRDFSSITELTDGREPASTDPAGLTADGERLLFSSAEELYILRQTDASPTRPSLPRPLASFSSDVKIVPVEGGVFLFERGLWYLEEQSDTPMLVLPRSGSRSLQAELSVVRGGELFFLARVASGLGTHELYRSDGTPEGTALAATGLPPLRFCIDLGCIRTSIAIETLGSTILVAQDEVLVRADLARGTFSTLLDVDSLDACRRQSESGVGNFCQIENLTRAGDRLFFTTAGSEAPIVLWTSDGTALGTVPVRELHPAPSGQYFGSFEEQGWWPFKSPIALGDDLLFVLQDPAHGEELWRSDGTEAGTALLRDIRPGPLSSFPRQLFVFEDRLVFGAENGVHGHELWMSDGTEQGTVLVADIHPGRGSSFPGEFETVGSDLIFAASDGQVGREPWRSDLTAEGTELLADLFPGRFPSSPRGFEVLGDWIYLNASNWVSGAELFAVPRDAVDCESCLVDDLFEVTVEWFDQNGGHGLAHAVPYDDHNLFFWFFGPQNLELLVKVLDGGEINGHHWVFYGALTDVEYGIRVENRQTGDTRLYYNPPGNFCGDGDILAFPKEKMRSRAAGEPRAGTEEFALTLLDGRFRVEVDWIDPNGAEGRGRAVSLTDATGVFWFFGPENLELVVKVLDGRNLNGRFWVYYGALTDVSYVITVTDTETGQQRIYENPPGEICGRGDIEAF